VNKRHIKFSECHINKALISDHALSVIDKLHSSGYEAFIVGGGVRDLLLGRTPKDFDVVTNAPPEKVRGIFKRNSIVIGRRFKIVHVIFEHKISGKKCRSIIEVSTYRNSNIAERHISQHGKLINDNSYGSQQDDAERRDFTINALYYDPDSEVIIDYHDGISDLNLRILRIIGDPVVRYQEDPVRILRAVRLATKSGLEIEQQTLLAIQNTKQFLAYEHNARLYEEMLKICLSGYAVACVNKLREINLPKNVFLLFDKLFFKANPSEFAYLVLSKTDQRIQNELYVSAIVTLAGLLWEFVYDMWKSKQITQPRVALIESINAMHKLCCEIGITKHTISGIRDLWSLQFDLEHPNVKKIMSMSNHKRFKQAWHLYSMRYEYGQVDRETYDWWNKFVESDETLRPSLVAELI
jgi:poly(A) polymerase